MAGGSPPRSSGSEAMKAEERFRETGDIRYAALVLGKWPDNPQEWALEACREYFLEKVATDPVYAAFAIGMCPDDPPQAALETCKKLAGGDEIAHQPVLAPKGRGAPGYREDEDLELMADLVLSGKSVHAAAMQVGKEPDAAGSNTRRLEHKWKAEVDRSPTDPTDPTDPSYRRPIHDRIERAARRWAISKGYRAPWDPPLTEIEE